MNFWIIFILVIYIVFVLICIESLLEILVFRKRLNNYFFIVNKGFIFKNTIFMSVNKVGKSQIRELKGRPRAMHFRQQIQDLIVLLPKGTIIRTTTHNTIKNMISDAQKNNLIKELKVKKTFPRPVLFEKLSIRNKEKLLKFKKFYKVSFIVV